MSETGHQLDSEKLQNLRSEAIRIFGGPRTGTVLDEECMFQFSKDEEAQKRFAVVYEYARESLTIRSEVERRRERRNLHLQFGTSPEREFSLRVGSLLSQQQWFPTEPWRKIPPDDRVRVSNTNKNIINSLFALNNKSFVVELENATPVQAKKKDPGPGIVTGTFWLDREADQKTVILAFTHWIRTLKLRSKPRLGRLNASLDQLNALVALRLRYHCPSLSDAQKKLQQYSKITNGPRFTDRRAFNRTCESAVRHFQSLLELPNELPLRFTSGWKDT